MEDIVIPIFAIAMVFGIPLAAILSGPLKQWMAQRERREARQLYERLTMEKLDVIKTAVAVGMNKHDLADLDNQLEQLIGADQLKSLLQHNQPEAPSSPKDVHVAELSAAELEDVYGKRSRRSQRN